MQKIAFRPPVVLQREDDIILLNPETRKWFLTSLLGASIIRIALEDGVESAAHIVGMGLQEIQVFLHDVETVLYSPHISTGEIRGCSVYITENCNMRCRHCRFACSVSQNRLSFNVICNYLDQEYLAGSRVVTITGGEPLMVKPITIQVLRYASEIGMRVMLLTNGSLVTREIASELARYNTIVQISVDSANPARFKKFRKYDFDAVVRGIDYLVAAGVEVSISCTLTSINLEDVQGVINFAIQRNASGIHFALLELGGRARQSEDVLSLSHDRIINFFDHLIKQYFIGLRNEIRIEDFEMIMQQLIHPPVTNSCNFGVRTSALYEDGQVYGCTNLCNDTRFLLGKPNEIDRRDQKAQDLVVNMPTVYDIDQCAMCTFRWVCLGGCKDRVLLAYGDLYHPDPHCQVLYFLFNRLLFEAALLVEKGEL